MPAPPIQTRSTYDAAYKMFLTLGISAKGSTRNFP